MAPAIVAAARVAPRSCCSWLTAAALAAGTSAPRALRPAELRQAALWQARGCETLPSLRASRGLRDYLGPLKRVEI
eukprot:CAMPEP_0115143470 /NCGR_PEP_ID=MMETSP0227-20121206/60798_1 /TAXON_ID=89957 /ORGANISM="Polarella glacialis, Strain CCMP 1383" /LENGTH=75 /DNA_ID=CAMNT_0002552321 /DNA_START=274 /DNA_END=501 /DNA_ORIENTATION=-